MNDTASTGNITVIITIRRVAAALAPAFPPAPPHHIADIDERYVFPYRVVAGVALGLSVLASVLSSVLFAWHYVERDARARAGAGAVAVVDTRLDC